jgi:methylmalonyl-CoA mutase
MMSGRERTAHLPAGRQGRILEESLYYETLKHNGDFPVIGVNTFLSSKGSPTVLPKEVIRATEEEKQAQIATAENLRKAYAAESAAALKDSATCGDQE